MGTYCSCARRARGAAQIGRASFVGDDGVVRMEVPVSPREYVRVDGKLWTKMKIVRMDGDVD